MGGCGSREKGPLDKTSLNTKEIEKCKAKFKKLSRIKPGKEGKFIALEGFQTAFPENQELSAKVYKWIVSQSETKEFDLVTFVLSMELLTKIKSELYAQSFQFKNLEQFQLILLISMVNPDVMKRDEFKNSSLAKLEVSYLQAGIFIKEIINMTSKKGQTLCVDDDLAAKLLINNIFGEKQTHMDLPSFSNAIKLEAPIINQTIRRYFGGKFTNSLSKIRLPDFSDESLIINDQILGLFFVSTQWLTTTNKMQLLYRYDGSVWNYDDFADSLLNAKSPTIILFRHSQDYKPHERHPFQFKNTQDLDKHTINYHFGFYCPTLWRQSSDMTGDQVVVTGDVNSSLFSIVPKYKLFSPARGDGQGKFAILSKKTPNQMMNNNKQYGLAIGGSGTENHRLWIDAQDIRKSYTTNEDKTFQPGYLCNPHTSKLNLEMIEVWSLEQLSNQQSLPIFRQTQINHISTLIGDRGRSSGSVLLDNNRKSRQDRRSEVRRSQGQEGFEVENVESGPQK